MWEGAPDYPHKGIWWELCERYGVTHLLHRPDGDPRLHEVGRRARREGRPGASCGCSGTVGEPINPKAWLWYHKVVGGERCPIVDTWWQTETGAIMITPLPGIVPTKPGSATRPFPGIEADVVDEREGKPIDEGQGLLVLHAAVAVDAAHALQGGRPVRRDLLLEVRQGDLPRRRRRAQGQGRLLLDHRADRRRGQRLRAPAVDGRGRVGDRLARQGRRVGGDRPGRRGHRPGDLRVRDARGRPRGHRRADRGDPRPRSPTGSASSRGPSGSSGPTTCPRPARARSCAGCCATSPRAARSATSPRCAIPT